MAAVNGHLLSLVDASHVKCLFAMLKMITEGAVLTVLTAVEYSNETTLSALLSDVVIIKE